MTKFNKRLLTAAVAGALSLAGAANAAQLDYVAGTQITYAKDLIVNNGTTITTPDGLRLVATSTNDSANLGLIAANEELKVKVTLTNGAKFDSNADVTALVQAFTEGDQTGGGGNPVNLSATAPAPYYSVGGQELNFVYEATAAGNFAGDYLLEINGLQITNLVQGLFDGDEVGVEITVQNSANVQVFAAKSVLAKSKWGLVTTAVPSAETTKKIDVGSTPDPKTWFAANGLVGGSGNNGAAAGSNYFHLGGITIDVAKAEKTGGGLGYVNNYTTNAPFNVVGTSEFTISLTANGLGQYGNNIAFSASNNCSTPVGTAAAVGDTITVTLDASDPLLANVTAASPGASTLHVCALADGSYELTQLDSILGEVSVDYQLPTQRVNPELDPVEFGSIDFNGTTLIFQNVNPASNNRQQSQLRLTNNNATSCAVAIDAKDDAGLHSDAAKLVLGPHESIQLESPDLENGNAAKGVTGGFGDGTGKWYVRVTAQCTNFKASALNRNNENGTVTNLTAEKFNGSEWLTPDTKLNP